MLLKKGKIGFIWKNLIIRLYSTVTSIGLELFTNDISQNVLINNDLNIRRFRTNDINELKEEMRHFRLVEENIPICYIAEKNDKKVVFRQWLFKNQQNERLQTFFNSKFPKLRKNEALLEGGFTHPDYRGQQIMAKAILNILSLDENKDIKRFITFVDLNNISSLKGLQKADFKPYNLRLEKWIFFKRRISFIPLPLDIEKSYFNLSDSVHH